VKYAFPANQLGARVLRCAGYDGEGVRVGIIDTGIAARTPVLRGRLAGFRNFMDDRQGVFDDNGHGTAMAAFVTSIAPKSEILMARAGDSRGHVDVRAVQRAMSWLRNPGGGQRRPDIVLMSFRIGREDVRMRRGIRRFQRRGIAVVAAAGNSGPGARTVTTPADYPEVLAVGATDAKGVVAGFSSRGPVRRQRGPNYRTQSRFVVKPDVMAPGVRLDVPAQARRGGKATGTSHAAAVAAGALALAADARPRVRGRRLVQLARLTAHDIGIKGRDPRTGYGRLDVAAMMHPRDPARGRCAARALGVGVLG
jgi:serine protease AprX